MERKTNISVWQLRLFEGFDKDVMVMQRDEEEIFDDAIHVFFEREYYDAYVAKAVKYGSHRYAYHEDKLGEIINQIFEENISGLVLHISSDDNAQNNTLSDEKYLANRELLGLKDAADSYHYLYTTATDRCKKEEAIARLWTKNVFIIGKLPDFKTKPAEGEKNVFELMTIKRKKDGSKAEADDFDYESLKVFLTADSAMRFNPDKKPVNKYKLSLLSFLIRGKLQVIIEPHRNFWLEYDPMKTDLTGYLKVPHYNEEKVQARIRKYTQMERIYVLLAPLHSDYRVSIGNPFLMKADEKNIMMYLYENYDDAVNYVLQNPTLLPVFDSTFPIGVLDQNEKLYQLETVLALAEQIGVTGVNLDFDTMDAIGCKLEYIKKVLGYHASIEEFLPEDELSQVTRTKDGEKQYRMPAVPFCDKKNDYMVSSERRAELAAHIDNDIDQGLAYMACCNMAELMVLMQEAASRFETAKNAEDEENKTKYARLMNRITIPLTEAFCERPYIYTLREENGDFILKNGIAYLIVTNRYEAGRKGEGRLIPAGVNNPQFMEKLCEATKVAAVTDGPSVLCLMDTRLMSEIAKQWKKSESLREELMIYLTQGCDLSYVEAGYYYRRLKSDSSIFVEFASAVRNGEYPPIGMLTIEGYTAKELAKTQGMNMLQAYDRLLTLKTDPEYAGKLKSGTAENETEASAEKKGFFGKLFQK